MKKNNGSGRAKETAYALLSEYGITSINLKTVIYITENKGIELFEYGSCGSGESAPRVKT